MHILHHKFAHLLTFEYLVSWHGVSSLLAGQRVVVGGSRDGGLVHLRQRASLAAHQCICLSVIQIVYSCNSPSAPGTISNIKGSSQNRLLQRAFDKHAIKSLMNPPGRAGGRRPWIPGRRRWWSCSHSRRSWIP